MAKLLWSSASQAKQAIQQSQLYPTTAANAQVDFQWMVNDQLGSPRMVIDKAGSLSGVKRRDFLPFGEDLQTGGRTWIMGYVGDSVRQKFTGYERDSETNLDFAHARYFSSGQGRFTGVDPMLASASASNPQTWNRYSYGMNNPLRYNDPSGMSGNDIGTAEDQRRQKAEQVVDIGRDKIINKKVAEIQKAAKPLEEGAAPVATSVVYIPGEKTKLQNATVIGDGKTLGKGLNGYMQPVGLAVLDQGGNIMKAPDDMFVVENVRPDNSDAQTLVEGNKQITSNNEERGQAGNGLFYDLQIRMQGANTRDIRTTQDLTVRQYSGPSDQTGRDIFKVEGNKIRMDDARRSITITPGIVKKL